MSWDGEIRFGLGTSGMRWMLGWWSIRVALGLGSGQDDIDDRRHGACGWNLAGSLGSNEPDLLKVPTYL